MDRIIEVDGGIARERRRLERAWHALREECDPGEFPARWRERVHSWYYDPEVNELIRQHNDWYPIERDLPMDIRTRDYVRVAGRSHRRPLLGPEWALEQFPPVA